ncbi:hypothetical protein DPEC_G00327690 [Dallia pectoralis]|uniref:Uncharacterized protein n=1 Tax=Dallia pectoralis TaxID=75939 RepID=A0ACC2F885_DALPE|nr:hypothetical protein DPEC_G00327690 [Dallia pectoralis]
MLILRANANTPNVAKTTGAETLRPQVERPIASTSAWSETDILRVVAIAGKGGPGFMATALDLLTEAGHQGWSTWTASPDVQRVFQSHPLTPCQPPQA